MTSNCLSKLIDCLESNSQSVSASVRDTAAWLESFGLGMHPFNVEWYNEFRLSVSPTNPQLIRCETTGSVGLIVLSNAHFFKEVVSEFDSDNPSTNFVENVVDRFLKDTLARLHSQSRAIGWNTDKPPYIHVQSIGHVAGIDEYVSPDSLTVHDSNFLKHRDSDIWGTLRDRILGVSIHPRYGGWYAYRMLIVLEGVAWPTELARSEPMRFLTPEEKSQVVYEYNENPDLCRWRDFNDRNRYEIERYDSAQYLFFHERSIDKRRRTLELLKLEGYHV